MKTIIALWGYRPEIENPTVIEYGFEFLWFSIGFTLNYRNDPKNKPQSFVWASQGFICPKDCRLIYEKYGILLFWRDFHIDINIGPFRFGCCPMRCPPHPLINTCFHYSFPKIMPRNIF